jgi:hypothetical protein
VSQNICTRRHILNRRVNTSSGQIEIPSHSWYSHI